MSSFSQKIL